MHETKKELDANTPIDNIPDIVAQNLQVKFQNLRGFNGLVRDNTRRVITYYSMGW